MLGGTQSLHTNSFDEALALPTEEAVRVALRTQQVIAHETGVTNTADPLGGSWFVEKLTDEMEAAAYELLRPHRRARRDGRGDPARTSPSARSPTPSFTYQQELDERRRIVVGVNDFTQEDEEETPILRIDPALERKQVDRLAATRAAPRRRRGRGRPGRAEAGRRRREENLMPPIIDAARARATEGEMIAAHAGGLRDLHRAPVFLS